MKLIKIGAEWCGPCHTMDNRLKDFDLCEVIKYNIDDETPETEEIIDKYKVRNIPVLVLEDDNGNELHKWVGAISLNEIKNEISKYE